MRSLAPIILVIVEGKGTATSEQEKEARQSMPWTLRELGGKTVWDWMELLIVPAVLAIITVGFTWYQSALQQSNEAQRAESIALQAYLDQMGQWLIEQDLDRAQQSDNIANLARARTLTILSGADDPIVKRRVIQFLLKTPLISAEEQASSKPPVSMKGADLRQSDLYIARQSSTNLSGTDLSNDVLSGVDSSRPDLRDANLANTDLSYTALIDTDLGNANLENANLTGADLGDADLDDANLADCKLSNAIVTQEQLEQVESLRGATMPDGSKHP